MRTTAEFADDRKREHLIARLQSHSVSFPSHDIDKFTSSVLERMVAAIEGDQHD